ncbi:MAG TPA: DUF559 domain-containing protein [Armatimonadota bacterium]|jgi:very-short-patch-repair endonuclease
MEDRPIVMGRHTEAKRLLAKRLRGHMTNAEQILWLRLRANRLDGWHFRRQQIIDGLVVDFYCHQARLVVELDGDVHEGREEYDAARDQALRSRGLTVLHFSNDQALDETDEVVREIRERLRG